MHDPARNVPDHIDPTAATFADLVAEHEALLDAQRRLAHREALNRLTLVRLRRVARAFTWLLVALGVWSVGEATHDAVVVHHLWVAAAFIATALVEFVVALRLWVADA